MSNKNLIVNTPEPKPGILERGDLFAIISKTPIIHLLSFVLYAGASFSMPPSYHIFSYFQ